MDNKNIYELNHEECFVFVSSFCDFYESGVKETKEQWDEKYIGTKKRLEERLKKLHPLYEKLKACPGNSYIHPHVEIILKIKE